MSIRYTLRHNIPSANLAEEDANDSSTWDLNLLRKHELAETDNHDIVYRKHDGEVVNWADAATQQANEILEEVQGISTDIDNQVTLVENRLAEIEEEAVTLTEEAEAANEAAQTALVQAELAVTESQASADSASWSSTRASEWASKTDGLVGDEDYSSKYYAQQSATSAQSASSDAAISQEVKERVITAETNAVNAQNSAIASANSASTSANTATTKAGEASTSATTATTKASEASASATTATTKASEASASATSASNSATTATTKASEASVSASSALQSATSASTSATNASASATSAQASADAAEQAREDIQAYYGVPVGFEFFSMNPNIPDGTLPLLGGEYSREMYASLWEWVQTQTGYLVSESTWAALSNTNNGNVPYYSDGDGSTTFRVPALKCWIKGKDGTETVGTYLDAGLPNITGSAIPYISQAGGAKVSDYCGAFKRSYNGGVSYASIASTGSNVDGGISLDASRSNSIYGNSTTVQPKSIVGMWLVKAYGAVVDNGSIDVRDYIDEKIEEIDKFRIPLGYEYFTFNPNIPQGSLPLFGGEYLRDTYSDLWNWVQQQTGYLKTESEWQDLSTAHNGNVPYYSDGDGSTTFRVPSLKCWVKGANGTVTEVGSYKAAGLPNITGHLKPNDGSGDWTPDQEYADYGGAVKSLSKNMKISQKLGDTPYNGWGGFEFDASKSNAIYGNSSTVQPESIVGMWLVKAYGTVVDTGQIDEQQYIDDRIATCLPLTGGTMNGNIAWTKGEIGYRTNTHTDPLVSCRQIIVTAGRVDSEWNDGNAKLALHTFDSTGVNTSENGSFVLQASDGTNAPYLEGSPNGNLKWAGKNIYTANIQPLTLQYSSNAIFAQSEFERCTAAYTRGFLVVCINMNSVSGKTTSDITTVGKIKNVNMEFLDYDIETIVDQGGRVWLLCLYDNGNDVDIRVYCTSTTGASRLGHVFTVPAHLN